jgi:hypothetical protein
MSTKLLSLRRADTCSKCSAALAVSTKAWWDADARTVECLTCHNGHTVPTVRATKPDVEAQVLTPVLDTGRAGISAANEFQRRVAKHERRVEETWGTGRLGKVAKFFSEEPQSTTAWAKGAEGERRVSHHLRRDLGERAIMLDDRKVPKTRGNIDHIVVAASGVWVIDAKRYEGRVERRDVGGWRTVDERLYINGRDQTRLANAMGWQVEAVQTVLTNAGLSSVPVHSALCFTDSDWGLFAKPFQIDGVWVTWAKKLVEMVLCPTELRVTDFDRLAQILATALPASA